MRLNFEGLAAMAERFNRARAAAEQGAGAAAVAACREIQDELPRQIASEGPVNGREAYVDTFQIRQESNPPGATLFTWAPYSRVLEYGINKIVQVRQHTRKGRPVRAHSMRMNRPPLHILRRAIDARRERAFEIAFETWRRELAL